MTFQWSLGSWIRALGLGLRLAVERREVTDGGDEEETADGHLRVPRKTLRRRRCNSSI